MRNEKDFSAGGMEFSSPGREFSPPRQEFSPVRAEFSPPRGEFAPVKAETQAAGEEFAQTAAPVAKAQKKRRVSPLMVTAAAVATSVVVISGVNSGSNSQHHELYRIRLDAAEIAVLESIEDALRAQDADTLIELAKDPALRSLVSVTMPKYFSDMHDDLGDGDFDDYVDSGRSWENEDGTVSTTYGNIISFDGTYMGAAWVWQETGNQFDVHTEYRTDREGYTYPYYVTLEWVAENAAEDIETRYPSCAFSVFYDTGGEAERWDIASYTRRNFRDEDQTWAYSSGLAVTVDSKSYSRSGETLMLTQMTGDCIIVRREEVEFPEDDMLYTHMNGIYLVDNHTSYLENGTIVSYKESSSGWETTRIIEVRDGYTEENGTASPDRRYEYEIHRVW